MSLEKKVVAFLLLTMSFLLYSFILYTALPVKNVMISDETSRGKLLWQQYNCTACHQLYGLGGYLGPDLTNVYSLKGPDYVKAFLQNGNTVMPNFHLTGQEISELLAYLKNIDESGKSDPRTFTMNNDGTIDQ